MSARPAAQHRTTYKLSLGDCLSQEWLSCLLCFRKHQVALQRLMLSTLHSQTLVEAEFFIYSASSDTPFKKNPLLEDLELLLGEMQHSNWILKSL